MKKINKIASIVLCVATAMQLMACGSSTATGTSAASSQAVTKTPAAETAKSAETTKAAETTGGNAASGDKGTIELWTCMTEGTTAQTAALDQIKKFESETGYKVNVSNFTYDMIHEKILTDSASGNVPDLVWGLPEYISEFYKMGIIEDLTSYYDSWDGKKELSSSVLKSMTIDNKLVGVPYQMTVRAFLVHQNDFDKAGVSVPSTWEDLMKLSDFHDKTGKYPTELACTSARAPQELLVYLAQYDLELCTAQKDGKYKNTWKDNPDQLAKATKVFQMYKDLVSNKIVDPNTATWGWEETDENLATDIVSSYVTGNWLAEREKGNADTMADVKVYPIPYPSDGHAATYMECKPLFIMKDAKNKKGAWELAKLWGSKTFQTAVFPDSSPVTGVATDSKWSKDFMALADKGIVYPPVTLGGITQNMQDALAKALQDNADAKETAEWLSDAINTSLSENDELSK